MPKNQFLLNRVTISLVDTLNILASYNSRGALEIYHEIALGNEIPPLELRDLEKVTLSYLEQKCNLRTKEKNPKLDASTKVNPLVTTNWTKEELGQLRELAGTLDLFACEANACTEFAYKASALTEQAIQLKIIKKGQTLAREFNDDWKKLFAKCAKNSEARKSAIRKLTDAYPDPKKSGEVIAPTPPSLKRRWKNDYFVDFLQAHLPPTHGIFSVTLSNGNKMKDLVAKFGTSPSFDAKVASEYAAIPAELHSDSNYSKFPPPRQDDNDD